MAPEIKATYEETMAGPFKFKGGQFVKPDGAETPIITFDIFSDGIAATATTTDIADLFLADALTWAVADLGFRPMSRKPREIRVSSLVVDFEVGMEALVRPIGAISDLITKKYAPHTNFKKYVIAGLSIAGANDDTSPFKQQQPFPFNLERRADAPLEMERYFSHAPLSTQRHTEYLADLERIALKQRAT
jgi:hypothetical protein